MLQSGGALRSGASPGPCARRGICSSQSRFSAGLSRGKQQKCTHSCAGPEENTSLPSVSSNPATLAEMPRQLAAKAFVSQIRSCATRMGDWMKQHRVQQLLFGCGALRGRAAGVCSGAARWCRFVRVVGRACCVLRPKTTLIRPLKLLCVFGDPPHQHRHHGPSPQNAQNTHRDSSLTFGGQSVPMPLLAAAVYALPVLPGGGVNDLFTNRVFLAGFWAWFTAQTLKVRLVALGLPFTQPIACVLL